MSDDRITVQLDRQTAGALLEELTDDPSDAVARLRRELLTALRDDTNSMRTLIVRHLQGRTRTRVDLAALLTDACERTPAQLDRQQITEHVAAALTGTAAVTLPPGAAATSFVAVGEATLDQAIGPLTVALTDLVSSFTGT